MSYHSKKSFASRFSGLIFVVGLHLAAVIALVLGLKPKGEMIVETEIEVATVEEQVEKVDPPPPPPPDYVPPPPDFAPPPQFNVAADAPAPANAITTTQVKPAEPAPVVAKAPPTPAKPPKRGLSAPTYPAESKKLGEEGVVGLSLYLNAEGKVQEAKVDATSGFPRLDESAVKHATRAWKFEPCTEDGKPVACWYKIKFRFQIQDA